MKKLSFFVYLYLSLPIIIFLSTWVKPVLGIPLVFLMAFSLFFVCKKSVFVINLDFKKNSKRLLVAFLIVSIWVYLSGVQKNIFQNTDSYIRNGILEVLVKNNWPVVRENNNQTVMLVYYMGFWLPSSLIGKIFGINAAYWFLYLWTLAGVYITYILICNLTEKIKLWPLLLFILFSGMDIIGETIHIMYNTEFVDRLTLITHLEWWNKWQFSSFTTQLFWVFNQAVPCWIATLLILSQKDNRNLIFILGCLLLQSTFPLVGLIPFAIYISINNISSVKNGRFIKQYFESIFTFENIIGYIIGVVSFIYLKANYSSQIMATESIANNSFFKTLLMYGLFIFLECFIFYILIFKYQKRNPLFYISFIILCICPLIKVGNSIDFCMRASIPSLIVLYVLVVSTIQIKEYRKSILFIFLLMVIGVGALTPVFEINRTLYNTLNFNRVGNDPSQSVAPESEIVTPGNFGGIIDGKIQRMMFDIGVYNAK